MEQPLYELPEGWEWDQLGQVLDVRDGTHDSPKYQQTGHPLVTSKNLTVSGLDLKNVKYISEEDFQQISKRSRVNKGDILFAMIGTIGNPIVIEEEPDFAIKNVALFKPRSEAQCMQYFRYFLLSPDAIDRMTSSSKGAAQKFVGLRVLRGFDVPLPPLNEQKRIVARLDALFTRIDAAITHLQETLELSKALFASALDGVFQDAFANHRVEKLQNVTSKIGSGATPKGGQKSYKTEGVSLIRSLNVYDTLFKWKGLAYIDDDQADALANVQVETGDVLLNITGASIARSCIVPDDVLPARVNGYSRPNLPPIPDEACHPFHAKAATYSGEVCHP